MTEFYRQLVRKPAVSQRVALREAKLILVGKSTPYHWAPFVLIGQ